MFNRAYWYLMSAQTIAALGDTFGVLAVQWMVYDLTHSYLAMAGLATASALPEFLLRLLLSPIIDRVNRVRLMSLLDFIRCFAYAIPVVLGLFGKLEIWHLYLTVILTGSCAALFSPASLALVPSLVKGDQLVRAISLTDSSRTTAMLLGPTVAGLTIGLFGGHAAMGVNAICYALSALLLFLLSRAAGKIAAPAPRQTGGTYMRDALVGFTFFKQAPALLVVMILVSLGNMSSVAMNAVLIPFMKTYLHLNATQLGLLLSFSSGGMLAGNLLVSIIGDIKRRRLVMLGSIVVRGLLMGGFGLSTSVWEAGVMLVCYGLCSPFFSAMSAGLYGRLVPEELRGRVMSSRLLLGGSLQPVGSMAGGSLATLFGLPLMFVGFGMIPALFALTGFFLPALRGIDGDLTGLTEQIRLNTRSGGHTIQA